MAKNQEVEDTSAETQEILKELAGEGYQIEGQEPKEAPAPAEEKPEPTPEPEKVEKAEEIKPEVEPEKEEPRESKYVPVSKFNEQRHELAQAKKEKAELEAKLSELNAKSTPEEVNDVKELAKGLAEKHGLDEEFLAEFADSIVKLTNKNKAIPDDIVLQFQAMKQKELENEHFAIFEKQFAGLESEFPTLAGHKEDFKRLAFTEGNTATPLRTLAIAYLHDNVGTPKKTAEKASTGRKDTASLLDFSKLTEDQLDKLTDQQYSEYMKWCEQQANY